MSLLDVIYLLSFNFSYVPAIKLESVYSLIKDALDEGFGIPAKFFKISRD